MAKELAKVEAPAGSEVNALAALPRDLAIVKMQDETMMSMAAAHPRDYVAILADIKQQIAAYKSFAQGIMYTKPVGGGKFASGLSIRAAESIKLAFGHCSVVTDVSIIDADTVRVSAKFTDFQSGNVWTDGGVLSKFYKGAGGSGTKRHPDDRFFNVVVKAELSRRVREVILRSVPAGLKSEIEKAALEALGEFMDDTALKSLMDGFAEKGVSVEQIEKLIGKRRENFLTSDRTKLLGLWNAVKDGESSINEVFGGEETKPLEDGESATDALAKEVCDDANAKA